MSKSGRPMIVFWTCFLLCLAAVHAGEGARPQSEQTLRIDIPTTLE